MKLHPVFPCKFPVKILVVDDHPNTATTLARAIAQLGPAVRVVSATSGIEAMRCIHDENVDILITDMIMPEMTGLELIEELIGYPAECPTLFFLMTAYDVPGLRVTAQRLKVKEVIVKPIRPERICQIVKKAIEEMNRGKPGVEKFSSQKSFNILIADDQPDNLVLLGRYLENEGYSYFKAVDGVDTLKKVRSELPDLVILDVNMPRKDGFAVLEEIRADPATQHIPVIILTAARVDPIDIQSGLNMGADDYITKPFDRRELLARVRTKLRVKEAEDAIRRRNRELNLLPEIGKELSARVNIDELASILLKRTVETFGAMFGHIVILNVPEAFQKTLHLDSTSDNNQYILPEGWLETAISARQGFIVSDTQKDPGWQSFANAPAYSVVVVPLFGRHNLLGVLLLANEHPGYFTQDHLLLLQAITSLASIGVENAQFYDAITREQQRLAAVLESAADAILMFEADGRLSLVNRAGEKLFTDYETKIEHRLEPGAGYDSFVRFLNQTRNAHDSTAGEVVWPDNRIFSALMTPIQAGGVVVNMHDVTHFKDLDRVKNEFVATASHDLKNPITTIKGFNLLVKQAGPLNDTQNEFVKCIDNAAENMNKLVDNLLNLAKMDLGDVQKHEELDVSSLLLGLAVEFQPQIDAKKQTLVIGKIESSLEVKGDALKLSQAIRNLISNAIKYTPNEGTITLSTCRLGNSACFNVKDTGYGISEANLPHIFKRFFRARDCGHDEIEGNGLGLAIVKSIAEQHGGDVSVESELGKGSSFTLTLPVIPCRTEKRQAPGYLAKNP